MFTGIIRNTASVIHLNPEGSNLRIRFSGMLSESIRIDQSIAHNGVCLTVEKIVQQEKGKETIYEVVAVEETLLKSNLGDLMPNDRVNLELALRAGDFIDGHFVQGHVDGTGEILKMENRDGSWNLRIGFREEFNELVVDKGSICVNGVSLTVVACGPGWFCVTVIPYTWEQTNFNMLSIGNRVNLEFDILGKYILKKYRINSVQA